MKKSLLVLMFSFSFFFLQAQDRFNFGVGATSLYGPFDLGAQVKAKFDIQEEWGTAATFSYYFTDDTDWALDLDQYYNDLIVIGSNLMVSPFAGLNIHRANDDTKLGLNLGLFSDFELDSGKTIYIEPKYLIKSNSQFVLAVGMKF